MTPPAIVRHRIDWRSDAGFVGGAEVLPFGLLIFVAGTLMVMNLWAVLDTKMALDGASREGARAVAESDSSTHADDRARRAADASLAAHGRRPTVPNELVISYDRGSWAPCARATVTVDHTVPMINVPFIGVMGGPTFPVRSTHSEIVDPYRSRTSGIDPRQGVRC